MGWVRMKSLLVATFSLLLLCFSAGAFSQGKEENSSAGEKKGFDANEVIFGHVKDAHEFHFLSYKGSDGEEHEAIVPLPVILYSPQKGFSVIYVFSLTSRGSI